MSENLLAVASTANEAAMAYREAVDDDHTWQEVRDRGIALADAVDALSGAIVEAENERGVVVPIGDLTRLREIEDVAGHRGVTIAEAVVLLVNEALSGTYLDGYRAAIEEHGIVETPPAVPGDGYAQDEPERDGATAMPERRLVELRALGQRHVGKTFVDPTILSQACKALDRRGEHWAASILGRDISERSRGVPNRPALRQGEDYVLVFADAAEDRYALGIEQ